MRDLGFELLEHPLYSVNMTSDYHVSPQMNKSKRRKFSFNKRGNTRGNKCIQLRAKYAK